MRAPATRLRTRWPRARGNGKSDGDGWLGFRRRVPELLEPELLVKFYSRSMLESELARKVFILPRGI